MKKLFVIGVAVVILATCFADNLLAKEIDKQKQTKIVKIYRYGIDGSITEFDLNIEIKIDEDLGEMLVEKCSELLKNDDQIQDFLQNVTSNLTIDAGLLLVKSYGRGFHFKTKARLKLFERVRLLEKFEIFEFLFSKIRAIKNDKIIFCRYNDTKAKTTIIPILRSMINESSIKNINGSHSVLVYDFIGYATWFGRFSFSPIDTLPRAFVGYGRLAVCNKL